MEFTFVPFRVYKDIYSFALFYPLLKTPLIAIAIWRSFLSLSIWQSVDYAPIVFCAIVEDNFNGRGMIDMILWDVGNFLVCFCAELWINLFAAL